MISTKGFFSLLLSLKSCIFFLFFSKVVSSSGSVPAKETKLNELSVFRFYCRFSFEFLNKKNKRFGLRLFYLFKMKLGPPIELRDWLNNRFELISFSIITRVARLAWTD